MPASNARPTCSVLLLSGGRGLRMGGRDKGLRFGKNLTSPQSPRETQPHWYVERFAELAELVGKGRQ